MEKKDTYTQFVILSVIMMKVNLLHVVASIREENLLTFTAAKVTLPLVNIKSGAGNTMDKSTFNVIREYERTGTARI